MSDSEFEWLISSLDDVANLWQGESTSFVHSKLFPSFAHS